MSSAAKAELGALNINAREAIPMHQLLEEMGHKQPKTPVKTDNSTAFGVINNNIKLQRTKAMDMHFHWLRCCNHKTNSGTIGNPEPTTELTTGPSIIAQLTTLKSSRKFSLQNSYSMPYQRHLTEHQQLWEKASSKQEMLPLLCDLTSTANQRY
jgi:hypothetical protein